MHGIHQGRLKCSCCIGGSVEACFSHIGCVLIVIVGGAADIGEAVQDGRQDTHSPTCTIVIVVAVEISGHTHAFIMRLLFVGSAVIAVLFAGSAVVTVVVAFGLIVVP